MRKSKIIYYVKLIALPVIAALVFRFLFNVKTWEDLWAIMSLSFFFGLPYLVGVVTIYLSKFEKIKSKAYQVFYPWLPMFVFCAVTLIFTIEGWACWIMILPIFLVLSSLGGATAGYIRIRKSKKLDKLQLSLALVLPFLISPVEQAIGPKLSTFKAVTSIEINAPDSIIWNNVTRVRKISANEDEGTINKWLGIPRPVEAELNYEGVNAERKAIFTGGLIFTEIVTEYKHQKYMTFSIQPNTGEIPSTTFDEHILIGGKYFDVLTGTYELEQLSNGRYRLHLWSEFEVNTTFNFYSGLWGSWIMKDIQNNILSVIKSRCEQKV